MATIQLSLEPNSTTLECLPPSGGSGCLLTQIELRLCCAIANQDGEATGVVRTFRVVEVDAARAGQVNIGVTEGAALTEVAHMMCLRFGRVHEYVTGRAHWIETLSLHKASECRAIRG